MRSALFILITSLLLVLSACSLENNMECELDSQCSVDACPSVEDPFCGYNAFCEKNKCECIMWCE